MMQQPMNAHPVQVVVVAHPGEIDRQDLYRNMRDDRSRQLTGLGIVHVLIGVLCIIFQFASLGVHLSLKLPAGVARIIHGFWAGPLFIITGIFGVAAGIQRNKYQVVAFHILSILSAVAGLIIISFSVHAANNFAVGQYCVNNKDDADEDSEHNFFDFMWCYYKASKKSKPGTATQTIIAILALIEFIVGIWSSIICRMIGACCDECGDSCGANCCPPDSAQNQFAMTGQQRIFIVNEQQATSNQQPTSSQQP